MAPRGPRPAQKPDPEPLVTDDARAIAVGTSAWAVLLVVLVVLRLAGAVEVPLWWLGMCAYGIALGLYGVRYTRRRDARADRAAVGPSATGPAGSASA